MRSRRRFAFVSAAFLLLLAVAGMASGCGGATIESVCTKCPGDASSSCVKDLTDLQTLAKTAGCDAEFQAALDCADGKATCDAAGMSNASDVCVNEVMALDTCAAKASGAPTGA